MKIEIKRKFSHERLYKLTKKVVIIVSILTLAYGIYMYFFGIDNILNNWKAYCGDLYKEPSWEYHDCMEVGLGEVSKIYNYIEKAFTIGILLPSIFFGGTWLYRYLFPQNNQ